MLVRGDGCWRVDTAASRGLRELACTLPPQSMFGDETRHVSPSQADRVQGKLAGEGCVTTRFLLVGLITQRLRQSSADRLSGAWGR